MKITRRAFGKDRRYPITNGFQATSAIASDEVGDAPRAPLPIVSTS